MAPSAASCLPLADVRHRVAERLRVRRGEIELAIAMRVFAIADPRNDHPEYVQGLRTSLTLAFDYALEVIEQDGDGDSRVPPGLLAQARNAARHGVTLDTVLRRYFAGYALLGESLVHAAAEVGEPGTRVEALLGGHALAFDQLVAAVSEEHRREMTALADRMPETRLARRVKQMLNGEQIDAADLAYDFGATHVGTVARGKEGHTVLHRLAGRLHKRYLLVTWDNNMTWAWFGLQEHSGSEVAQLHRAVKAIASQSQELTLALGEPAPGLGGWQLTHNQAAAALPFAHGGERVVRYASVALDVSVAADELLSRSLRQIYLDPLADEQDGGEAVRATLRSYLSLDRNISSTAATLGVNRQTVRNRLLRAEDRLGRSISECGSELDIALRLASGAAPRARASADDRSVPPGW